MTPSERRNLLMLTGVGLASMPAVLGLAGFTNMLLRSRKFRKDLDSAPDSKRRTLKELEEDGTIPKGSKILHGVDEIARTGFHTGYTDSYGPDTDPRKPDKELLAEYLAKKVTARLAGAARSQGAPHLQ